MFFIKLLSFGEALWDVYPDNKYIGGAPLNFAAHFSALGGEAYLLSCVGDDYLGDEILKRLEQWGVKTDYVFKESNLQTGKCLISLNESQMPSYNLLNNVAYDFIKLPESIPSDFDALYFGTFALRSVNNIKSLKKLLESVNFKEVFVDINIRAPFYSKETINFALSNSTILKISGEELPIVLKNIDLADSKYNIAAEQIADKFKNIKLIIITLGENGAFAYKTDLKKSYSCDAKKVDVVSTVGAGDSFSAAFLLKYSKGLDVADCIEFASKISGFVVASKEAVPDYDFANL